MPSKKRTSLVPTFLIDSQCAKVLLYDCVQDILLISDNVDLTQRCLSYSSSATFNVTIFVAFHLWLGLYNVRRPQSWRHSHNCVWESEENDWPGQDELLMAVTEVETIVNSRPLSYMSHQLIWKRPSYPHTFWGWKRHWAFPITSDLEVTPTINRSTSAVPWKKWRNESYVVPIVTTLGLLLPNPFLLAMLWWY